MGRWVAVVGAGATVGLPLVAALGSPGYSHRSQYISELGARGAPDGALVSVGFVAIGVVWLAWTALAIRRFRAMVGTATAIVVAVALVGGGLGASYAVTGVARCDPGCPETGDLGTAQQVHGIAGSLGYTLAAAGLVTFAVAARRDPRSRRLGRATLVVAPVAVALAAATASIDGWRGALQRALEVVVVGWLLAAAWSSGDDRYG